MTQTRILALANREDFVGRDAELRQIAQQASRATDSHGLVLMAAPGAGASELLRQSYDQLFHRRGDSVPLHFACMRSDVSGTETARRFFRQCLQQYVAYRRIDPSLCEAPLTFHEDRKSTRLNSSHIQKSRMPSSA